MVIEILRSTSNNVQPKLTRIQETDQGRESQKKTEGWSIEWCGLCAYQHTIFLNESQFYIVEDNKAVIKNDN